MVVHALTFDVEEWFDGNLHRDWVPGTIRRSAHRLRAEWERVLEVLEQHQVKATFFILGRVAEAHPHLVRATAAAGHEVGSHGYSHQMVSRLSTAEFAAELDRTRKVLQDLSGQPVLGFRAPSWSIQRRQREALLTIWQAGHSYSSSIFPLRTPLYGDTGAPTEPYWHHLPGGKRLLEIPPAVLRLGPLRFPFGGGFYWRLWPEAVTAHLLRRSRMPKVTYLHPWELNPQPVPLPRRLPWLARLVLTHGVGGAQEQFQRLLAGISFAPMAQVYASALLKAAAEAEEGSHEPVLA